MQLFPLELLSKQAVQFLEHTMHALLDKNKQPGNYALKRQLQKAKAPM